MPSVFSFDYVKEHPYKAGAVIFVAGIALVYIYHSQSASSQSTAAPYDPSLDPSVINAEIAAASQQEQINAQASYQTNQLNAQITAQQNTDAAQLAIATLQAHTADNTSVDQLALGLAQTNASQTVALQAGDVQLQGIKSTQEVQDAGIAAQVADTQIVQGAAIDINEANNITNRIVSEQTNQTAQVLSGQSNQTQQVISANQSQVAITQTQAATAIAKGAQGAGLFGQVIGAVAGIAGAILA